MEKYFESRKTTVGRSVPTNVEENGKKIYKVWTEEREYNSEDWQSHFEGKTGLGLSPILEDGTAVWSAVDIDNKKSDIQKLSIKFSGYPFFFCRTKSGGVHVYMFFAKHRKGEKLIYDLNQLVLLMQLPPSYDKNGRVQKTEIFPKQAIKEEGQGNWINLPYFNSDNTDRYCVFSGVQLTKDQFTQKISENLITNLKKIMEKFIFFEAPPCVQKMLSDGVTEGQRHIFILNAGVFLKKKYPDNWKEKLREINSSEYIEPIPEKDLIAFHNQLGSKDIFYQCATNMKPYCDKSSCAKRDYGFMTDNSPEKAVGAFKKVVADTNDKDVLYWLVTVYDIPIKMSTEDITDQKRFRRLVIEKCNELLPTIKSYLWDEIIQDRLKDVEVEVAPEDSGKYSILEAHIKSFFVSKNIVEGDETAIDRRLPVRKDGFYYFSLEDLNSHLTRKQYKVIPAELHYVLKQLNAVSGVRKRFGNTGLKRLWQLPVYEEHKQEQEKKETSKKIPSWESFDPEDQF